MTQQFQRANFPDPAERARKTIVPAALERANFAFNIFRGGFPNGHPNRPPHWDDLPPWIRDALTIAYLQGKLDGSIPRDAAGPAATPLPSQGYMTDARIAADKTIVGDGLGDRENAPEGKPPNAA